MRTPGDVDRPGWPSRLLGSAGGRRAAWRLLVLRRGAAALLVVVAVTTGLGVLRPSADGPAVQHVVVAAHPLEAGAVLTATDLATRSYPLGLAPAGASSSTAALIGRSVAGPVASREVLTPGRLVDTALLAGLPTGAMALPMTASVESTTLLRPGLRVDGFVPGRAEPVVRDALVLAVAVDHSDGLGAAPPATRVVLAVTGAQASAAFAAMDPAAGVTGLTFAAR